MRPKIATVPRTKDDRFLDDAIAGADSPSMKSGHSKGAILSFTTSTPSITATKLWICQLVVALTQTAFVIGTVYLKGSLKLVNTSIGETFSPLVYAFAREACAGPILYFIAWLMTGVARPQKQDVWRVVALGSCMYFSQLCYIIGLKLSGVVVATCMQPVIPVFTVLLGVMLHMEAATVQKLGGIGLAVVGAVCMVVGGAVNNDQNHVSSEEQSNLALGNFCLLINTMAMACYYILGKKLVAKYTPSQVIAWAYIVAATFMGATAANFTTEEDWNFPQALYGPLAYWIIVCSVAGYYTITWAMKHLPPSQVAAFQCLQPFLGSLLAYLVLHEQPSWWDLGAIGVILGLFLVSSDRKDTQIGAFIGKLKGIAKSRSGGRLVQLASPLPQVKVIKESSAYRVFD